MTRLHSGLRAPAATVAGPRRVQQPKRLQLRLPRRASIMSELLLVFLTLSGLLPSAKVLLLTVRAERGKLGTPGLPQVQALLPCCWALAGG